jgi:hypothetical protein
MDIALALATGCAISYVYRKQVATKEETADAMFIMLAVITDMLNDALDGRRQ